MRSPVNPVFVCGLLGALLVGQPALARRAGPPLAPMQPATSVIAGPGADFPVVLGDSYTLGDTTFTPSNVMNVDAVGRAMVGTEGGSAISAAHHTVPLPSYVEVTALDSGRTILVRVDRRGPMGSNDLIELSPGAAAQLGVSGGAGVRVRRANPPETERAELRAGRPAPERIPTPKPLLAVLVRRLTGPAVSLTPAGAPGGGAGAGGGPMPMAAAPPSPHGAPQRIHPSAAAAPMPGAGMGPVGVVPPSPSDPAIMAMAPAPRPHVRTAPRAQAAPALSAADAVPSPPLADVASQSSRADRAPSGALIVQVGAFAVKANATSTAARIDAQVSASGHIWRVRMGPFASQADAEAALAKARAAGFGGARIERNN